MIFKPNITVFSFLMLIIFISIIVFTTFISVIEIKVLKIYDIFFEVLKSFVLKDYV